MKMHSIDIQNDIQIDARSKRMHSNKRNNRYCRLRNVNFNLNASQLIFIEKYQFISIIIRFRLVYYYLLPRLRLILMYCFREGKRISSFFFILFYFHFHFVFDFYKTLLFVRLKLLYQSLIVAVAVAIAVVVVYFSVCCWQSDKNLFNSLNAFRSFCFISYFLLTKIHFDVSLFNFWI